MNRPFDWHSYTDTFGLRRCTRTPNQARPAAATVVMMRGDIAGFIGHKRAAFIYGIPGPRHAMDCAIGFTKEARNG